MKSISERLNAGENVELSDNCNDFSKNFSTAFCYVNELLDNSHRFFACIDDWDSNVACGSFRTKEQAIEFLIDQIAIHGLHEFKGKQ